jgi:hypothetical protein
MTHDDGTGGWRRDLAAAILTSAGLWGLILAAGGIWQHVGGFDLHAHFLPRYLESARALMREGRLPLWNPWEFGGTPLFAQAQGLSLYLPVPVLFAVLPAYGALQLLYAVNLLVLSWGCIAYLRGHGIARPAGAFAALVATAGVFSTPSGVGIDHPNFLASVAWIPWIVLCWERAVRLGARPWLGRLALALGAQWLAGYPDFGMDTAVVLGVVALVGGGAGLLRRGMLLVAGLGLGAALGAVVLVPLGEAVSQSFRAAAESEYVQTRLVLALGRTGMWRHQIAGAMGPGVATLLLAALALTRPTRVRLAWLAAAVWTAFALDPPFGWLYVLPPFRSVRYPFGWSHMLPVFVGFLAAAGAAIAFERRRPLLRVLAGLLLVAGVARAAATVHRAPTRGGFKPPDYALLDRRLPELERLRRALPGPPRLFSNREMNAGSHIRTRLPGGAGYDPTMPPRRPRELIDAINAGTNLRGRTLLVPKAPHVARLLGIGLVVTDEVGVPELERHGFRVVGSVPPGDKVLYLEPVPRLRVVDQVYVEADDAAMLRRTLDPARDLIGTAVALAADASALAEVRRGAREGADARIVAETPEHVSIETQAAAPVLLVLADTHYPGWAATLDGTPVPILRVDHTYRGVILAAGSHQVEFHYRPASLRVGAAVSALALLAVAVLIFPLHRSTD